MTSAAAHEGLGPDFYPELSPEFAAHFPLYEKSDYSRNNPLRAYDRRKAVNWPKCMHGQNCVVQVNHGDVDGGRRFWRCPVGWNYFASEGCKFTQWIDPQALFPYQEYIAYLHLVIDDLKREIDNMPTPEYKATQDDDHDQGNVASTQVICDDPYCCCTCHEDKSQPPPPPPPTFYPPSGSQNSAGSLLSLGGYVSPPMQ